MSGSPQPERGVSYPVAALFMVAVFLLGAAFIASYVGGLHAPHPHRLPVAVVGPPDTAARVGAALDRQGDQFDTRAYPTAEAAQRAIRHRDVYGAYVPQQGRLLVTTAFGPATSGLIRGAFAQVAAAGGQTLSVRDVVPADAGDSEGLVPFYLVIAWIVSGYLVAAIVGLYRGMASMTLRNAVVRLLAFAVYSAAIGAAGTLIVETGYGYLPGHPWLLTGVGALCVFAVAVATAAAESLLGIIGTALAILVFVVLGNPSAGGPWPLQMLPGFWRDVGPWLPNWAGTEAVRNAVYFDGNDLARPLIVLGVWAAAGIVLVLLLAGRSNPVMRFPGR
ncbi:DUF3533 domain-containing protein [Actinomadura bangladeshensis]|uniref:DUF3533 domain-containing protein n=1 Tax=Actinomadura bangladeshensis TaxID=453573 RepID=A0A6L9QER9_9ACTN|nr:DUF3533 domain-containing protein [Actinomadura bangladeshensis]NEA23213.1 DUF3533 domain-containing protein [Actinomadura bangladeshensis]